MKKSIALTQIVGGLKRPNTGRTVTLKDVGGNLIATATETPASSGVYEVSFTATSKYGYWYVDGIQKDAYGNNSPFWLGNYNQISASNANITAVTSSNVNTSYLYSTLTETPTIITNEITTDLIHTNADSNLLLKGWSDTGILTVGETEISSNQPFKAPSVITATSPVYNVKYYGAMGDGVTDDRVAIQAAINACSGSAYGGVVYFPAGEYKTGGGFEINSNMTIKGDGREATKISSINYGAGQTFSSGSTTAFFHGTDVDNVVFKDFWLRGVSIDGASSQGIVLNLLTAGNTAHILMENLLVTDMCSNSAIYIDTPILTTLINVKVLRNAGIGFHFFEGTSTDLYECYSITNTEAGFYFDTMTYCVLNGCASEVSGIGFDFKSCSSIVLNGCGTEAILNRYSDFERYGYGNRGQLRGVGYDGFAYRSRSSHIQLNSCYSRDPDVGHTTGTFEKINMREFTLGVTQPRVSFNGAYTSSIEGANRTTLASDIVSTATSLNVSAGTGVNFPTGGFYATIYSATYSSSYAAWISSNPPTIRSEVMYVTTRTGDTFSGLTRGQYNGTADYWTAGAKIELADKYNYAVAFTSASVISDVSGYPYRGFHNLAQIVLTDVPVDPDNVATGRKIYRTKANGHILYEVATINDNTTTTFTDIYPDSVLTASKETPHRFTGNTTTDYVTVEENPFVDGDRVMVDRDDGILPPSPLWTTSYYTVTQSSGNDLRLKASGSSTYVDLTTTGSGDYVHLYQYQPIDIDIANDFITSITGSITSASVATTALSATSASYAVYASDAGSISTHQWTEFGRTIDTSGTTVRLMGGEGSNTVLGTITVPFATSSSFAATASYAMNGGGRILREDYLTATIHVNGNIIVTGSLNVASNVNVSQSISFQSASIGEYHIGSTSIGTNNLFTLATGSYDSSFIKYSAKSGSNSRVGEVMLNWNGTTVEWEEVSTKDIGNTNNMSFDMSVVTNTIKVDVNTTTAGWKIKSLVEFL